MQVTDEMIEKAKAELFKAGMVDVFSVRAALTTALSEQERAVEVKGLEWNPYRAETPFEWYEINDQRDVPDRDLKGRMPFLLCGSRMDYSRHATLDAARAAAQADYEARIRSALVGVPVEPVAWALKFNSSIIATTFKPDEAAYMKSANANCDLIPLYPAPPLSRQGEDSAEVDGLTKALMAAYEEFNRIACEGVTETRNNTDALERCHTFANRGATSIREALAATRSGSATNSNGGDHAGD